MNKRLAKTTTDPANTSAPVTDIETRLLNLETHQTQARAECHQMSSRINKLLYQTQNRTDYGDVGKRIDNLESGLDKHESIIQNISIRLMGLETEIKRVESEQAENDIKLGEIQACIEENQSNLTQFKTILVEEKGELKNLSRIMTNLNMNCTTNYVSVLNLTVELSNVKDVLQREVTNNEEYEIAISQLETGWDFLSNIVQNHTTRITELEKDTSTDRSSIHLHEEKIAELTTNLSLESSFVKANNDSITIIGSNLMQLETSSLAQNASLLIINDRLAQIEFDIAGHQEALELQGSSMTREKNNIFALNLTLQNHSSRMDENELDKIHTQDMIDINNLKLTRLGTHVAELNGSLNAEKDINVLQNRRLLELTSLLNETRNAIDEYNATSTNHTGKKGPNYVKVKTNI